MTAPSVQLPQSYGVRYTAEPVGPYDGSQDTTVTVNTTVVGHGWGPMPPGWTVVETGRATYSVVLVGTTCARSRPSSDGRPGDVHVGVVTTPTLTLPLTDGITYAVDPAAPFGPGQTVTVTASLDPTDVGWPSTLPPGWVSTSATVAVYEETFDDASCQVVEPVAPTVNQAACVDDAATIPAITLSETAGLVYVVDLPGPYGPTGAEAVVTANLVEGSRVGDHSAPAGLRAPGAAAAAQAALPAGWTLLSPTAATFPVTLPPAPDCATASAGGSPATPETPSPETPAPVTPSPETPTPETPTAPTDPGAPGDLALTGAARTAIQLVVAALALVVGSLLVRTGRRRRLH